MAQVHMAFFKTRSAGSRIGLILLLLVIASLAQGEAIPVQQHKSISNLLVLELRLDQHLVSDGITAYEERGSIFLPLGELTRLLTLAIKTQPEERRASGYVLQEERPFNLDLKQSKVMLAERIEVVDLAQIKVEPDDIYVASPLIERWLPIDLDIDLSRLSLHVHPRETLPLQFRIERERRGSYIGSSVPRQDPGYSRHDSPYRLLGAPFIDQTFALEQRSGNGRTQTDTYYTGYLTADLLGMESALFINHSRQTSSQEVRFSLGRHDPDAGLLGPLHARSLMVGSLAVPGVANITRTRSPGNGLMISNRPIGQPTSSERHTLQGALPPGWDVELYFNDALVGFQQSRPDGRYNFDDLPLIFGHNEFRLVFHGPLGQLRVERQTFLLEQTITPEGEFYYNIVEQRDEHDQRHSVAQFDLGLGRHLSASGGLVRLPLAGTEQQYANLGLRTSWRSFVASSDFVRSHSGGTLGTLGLKTRIGGVSLDIGHARLRDFSSDFFLPSTDPVRTRDTLRLDSTIPFGSSAHLPLTVEAKRDRLQSGADNLEVASRISAYVYATSMSNQLRWLSFGNQKFANGNFHASRRVGKAGLRGQVDYDIRPQSRLTAIALSADRSLAAGYMLNVGASRSFLLRETWYSAGLSKSLGSFGLRINTRYSSRGKFDLGVQLFLAMGIEPRQSEWLFDALPMAGTGAASARVFLDKNLNGTMDEDDEPLKDVAFTVNNGRQPARTNEAGIAYLPRLPAYQNTDIAIDSSLLEDPQWSPQPKGVRLIPRRGTVAEIDFPVVMTSEIDGTVYFVDKDSKRPIGDVVLELLDKKRNVVAQTKSASDGFYIVPAIQPGDYLLRISPEQLKRLQLSDTGSHLITVSPDGTYVNGRDFLLIPKWD